VSLVATRLTWDTTADRAFVFKGALSETATLALLYTKFTSFAFPLRPLLSELELRAAENPSELGSLLDECHSTWVSVRKTLIGPRVEREVKRMEPWSGGMGLVELVSAGIPFLREMKLICAGLWPDETRV
jgi:hypothetical protein